jgi:hypothetical protein
MLFNQNSWQSVVEQQKKKPKIYVYDLHNQCNNFRAAKERDYFPAECAQHCSVTWQNVDKFLNCRQKPHVVKKQA